MILGSNPGFNHKESSSHQHRQGELVTKACSSLTLFGEVVASNKVVFRETHLSLASYMGFIRVGLTVVKYKGEIPHQALWGVDQTTDSCS